MVELDSWVDRKRSQTPLLFKEEFKGKVVNFLLDDDENWRE